MAVRESLTILPSAITPATEPVRNLLAGVAVGLRHWQAHDSAPSSPVIEPVITIITDCSGSLISQIYTRFLTLPTQHNNAFCFTVPLGRLTQCSKETHSIVSNSICLDCLDRDTTITTLGDDTVWRVILKYTREPKVALWGQSLLVTIQKNQICGKRDATWEILALCS